MWWCVSAHHCTRRDDTQGQLYENKQALAMFHTSVRIMAMIDITKEIKTNDIQEDICWVGTHPKQKKIDHFALNPQCLVSALRKWTSFIWKLTKFPPRKTVPTHSLTNRFTLYWLYGYWMADPPPLSIHSCFTNWKKDNADRFCAVIFKKHHTFISI